VLREHGPTKRIDLDLPGDLKARAREPQIEPADAGEETADGQRISHVR
jgi:hypothetical protein